MYTWFYLIGVSCAVLGSDTDIDPLFVPKYHLELKEDEKKLLFEYLDKDGDGVLLKADREKMFNHHPEAAPNVAKILNVVGCEREDGSDLDIEKFSTFIEDKTVTLAVYECTFVRSRTLKNRCYEDQLVPYVHLLLPNDVISEFYRSFNAPNGITIEQAKLLFPEDKEDRAHKLLREMAGEDEIIQEAEFDIYVRQEDLHDDFRACKDGEYDYDCLRNKLAKYTTEALTEMEIGILFHVLESSTEDRQITATDISAWCHDKCDPIVFLTMMNPYQDDSAVNFGEFRTFIKRATVKIRIEKSCRIDHPTLKAEIKCYQDQLFQVVSEHHKPVWLWVPSADILFLFEDLDENNNGQIQVEEDLKHKGYSTEVAEKFRREIDGDDHDKKISLEEFNEYMASPSIIYAFSVCKTSPRGTGRIDQYKIKLEKYITIILEKDLVERFFKSYDTSNNDVIAADDLGVILEKQEEIDNFLFEMAVGDLPIIRAEFSWYVRQEEVSSMFIDKECEQKVPCLQSVLLTYILTKLTEPTIQQLFRKLDRDFGPAGGGGIEYEDLRSNPLFKAKSDDEVQKFIQKMDPDKDNLVNFEEFRQFLWFYDGKKKLEELCTVPKKIYQLDMHCYMEEIWHLL